MPTQALDFLLAGRRHRDDRADHHSGHFGRKAKRVVKTDEGSPILDEKGNWPLKLQGVEQADEVERMGPQTIFLVLRGRRLAEPHMVRDDDPMGPGE